MKKTLIGAAAFVLGLTGLAVSAAPASAAETGVHPVESACNTGWYTNPDEGDRLPKQVEGGLEFKNSDLVHHATSTTVEDLDPGTFKANETPDQDSFFSVEVYSDDGGYATLRWNTATDKWDMVTGGQLYSDKDPAVLVDMVTPHKSHKVISFGVGYTANPPGTKTVVVSSITFAGTTYNLTCPAKPADEKVADEKWECTTGYSTRGGTVEYAWDAAKHEWVKKAPVWGDWVKQRDLTDEESKKLECQTTEPTTPPATPPADKPVKIDGAPVIGKITCDKFEYSVPNTDAVNWTVDVLDVKDGVVSVKFTATAKDGFVIDGQHEWTKTFNVPANCTATPKPSTSTSPASGDQLPVTGPGGGTNVPLIATLAGVALIGFGGAGLAWARRRRDNVEFTA